MYEDQDLDRQNRMTRIGPIKFFNHRDQGLDPQGINPQGLDPQGHMTRDSVRTRTYQLSV